MQSKTTIHKKARRNNPLSKQNFEANSEMTQVLELSVRDYKIITVKRFNEQGACMNIWEMFTCMTTCMNNWETLTDIESLFLFLA